MYDGCFKNEQDSYDQLKPVWPALPDTTRVYCNEIATFGGGGSYPMLMGCVKGETESAERNEGREFKF